uniref:Uncharacterized protein n=1 Tax=Utricularia reniformis TaxID=192314 RepID=A0A1Y0B1I6_9LAMI|nr:hypothetical protein AEK19_MT1011 [Utricularia reniformis]ART31233.1 hypothetical protein AEK19_MT1011 [Utricularia reniformis]
MKQVKYSIGIPDSIPNPELTLELLTDLSQEFLRSKLNASESEVELLDGDLWGLYRTSSFRRFLSVVGDFNSAFTVSLHPWWEYRPCANLSGL